MNDHEHTLHSVFFFADRHTHLHKSYMHEHVTNLYDQTETNDIPTEIKTKIHKKQTKSVIHLSTDTFITSYSFLLEQRMEESMATTETKQKADEHVYIELDIKCR